MNGFGHIEVVDECGQDHSGCVQCLSCLRVLKRFLKLGAFWSFYY